MTGKRRLYTNEELKVAVEQSICWTDVCKLLRVTVCTFNFKRLQNLCHEHGVSIEHFNSREAYSRGNSKRRTFSEIFCVNSPISRSSLRECCVRYGLYTGKCDGCGGDDTWNGKPLVIEVDHVNGDNTDHRVENLRWMCPNCHSQTPTFRRRLTQRTE